MALTIGTNILSLRTQRSLDYATSSLSRSYERLSSGARINFASDDAAGLAIADRLRADARLSTGAIRNINDGISSIQILTSSLQSQLSIMQRLQELAAQSANGVYSSSQRRSLNSEYQTLLREFGRIGDSASFNGVKLLLGGHGSSNPNALSLQAGITGASSSSISFSLTDSGTLSGRLYGDSAADFPALAAGAAMSWGDIEAQLGSTTILRHTVTDSQGRSRDILLSAYAGGGFVAFNSFVRGDQSNSGSTSSPDMWVVSDSISVTYDVASGVPTGSGFVNFPVTGFAGGATANVSLDIRGLRFIDASLSRNDTAIQFSGVETASQALTCMNILSARQSEIQNLLGSYGAVESRLRSASLVLAVGRENALSAESRIRDVDVADESSQLVKNKILQQSASAVLAQANQQPALAISLLKNI